MQMNGRDNDGRPMKIDWTDNKEVAVKKKYGSQAAMVPRGSAGGAGSKGEGKSDKKVKGGKRGKSGMGGKGIPKHQGKAIKFDE